MAWGVKVVAPGSTYVGKQGFTYNQGASFETVGAKHICMSVLPMPPGARARAHYHSGIETIAYLVDGECTVHYGPQLEETLLIRSGEQVYMPADIAHVPSNESGKPCTWVVVHSAGSDQDGIVMLPELDDVLDARLK